MQFTPAIDDRKMNFCQRSRFMSSCGWMSMLAALAASTKAASLASGLPSMRPTRMVANFEVWRITPGPPSTAAI